MLGFGQNTRTASVKRREGLRRTVPRPVVGLAALLRRPEAANCVVIGVIATVICAVLTVWSTTASKVAVGQVATETRFVRSPYVVVDDEATRSRRDEARRGAPRIYSSNEAYLGRLRTALERLPEAVFEKVGLDGVDQELVQEFALTEARVRKLQEFAPNAPISRNEEWRRWVDRFFGDELLRDPLLDPKDRQLFLLTQRKEVILPTPAGAEHAAARLTVAGEGIAIDQPVRSIADWLVRLAENSGVSDVDLAQVFVTPLLQSVKPTVLFNEAETTRRAEAEAAAVAPVVREAKRGDMIYLRGDVLDEGQVRRAIEEGQQYLRSMAPLHRTIVIIGVIGLGGLVFSLLSAYLLAFYPQICRRPLRLAAIYALMLGLAAAALAIAIEAPWTLVFVASSSTLMVAMVLTLSYDRRLAIFVSTLHCLLTSLLLDLGPSAFIALLCGAAAMTVQLREVRHRTALIQASLTTAGVLALAMALATVVRLPNLAGLGGVAAAAFWAATAAVATGFFMLGILPTLERVFEITTGLTLAEMRDPKQPLLRQLQQKAPGTYNHSLQIANIAEAAADAIGADGLLVYVGALYHDIGKMNKPEYFVENQGRGPNKHDKLSPAMSLLVIVGHVKDGVELAREYKLPRRIRHFIESHHGTSLVEYFFNAARERAEASGDGEESIDEVRFRYPGPKPQTKEAAILMIADVVESATRAMTEPNPSRIEALVRSLARRRLDDGQFDECDLTLRELTTIEESIIKSMNAIYHGRISYSGTPTSRAEPATTARPAVRAG